MTRSNNRPWLGREEEDHEGCSRNRLEREFKEEQPAGSNVIATDLEYRSIQYWLVGDTRNLLPNFNVVQISFWIMCWHFNKVAKKGNSYLSDVDNDRPSSERINLAAQFSEMSVAVKQSKMKLWSSKVDKIEKLCQNFFDSRQNCATFKKPPFVWRTESLQNRNPSEADFPFLATKSTSL